MARFEEKSLAIQLRKQGKSYSEIKEKLCIGKGTLSVWLREYPLSKKDLVRLRDRSPIRIEKFRETMRKKREERLLIVRKKVESDIKNLPVESYLLAGFFLYWGEGGKTKPYSVCISNTDPSVLQFFIGWLELLGWLRSDVKVKLQLYSDMNQDEEIKYWQKTLKLSKKCFQKPYIKKSLRSNITYKSKHSHGTCNVVVDDRDLSEYVLQGLDVIREMFSVPRNLPVLQPSVGCMGERA